MYRVREVCCTRIFMPSPLGPGPASDHLRPRSASSSGATDSLPIVASRSSQAGSPVNPGRHVGPPYRQKGGDGTLEIHRLDPNSAGSLPARHSSTRQAFGAAGRAASRVALPQHQVCRTNAEYLSEFLDDPQRGFAAPRFPLREGRTTDAGPSRHAIGTHPGTAPGHTQAPRKACRAGRAAILQRQCFDLRHLLSIRSIRLGIAPIHRHGAACPISFAAKIRNEESATRSADSSFALRLPNRHTFKPFCRNVCRAARVRYPAPAAARAVASMQSQPEQQRTAGDPLLLTFFRFGTGAPTSPGGLVLTKNRFFSRASESLKRRFAMSTFAATIASGAPASRALVKTDARRLAQSTLKPGAQHP
jgi:hypothetical protein